MPKTREQKKEIITDLKEKLGQQKSMVLVNFGGIDSKNLFQLRDDLKKENCLLKIVKKTLLKMVLKDLKETVLAEKLEAIQGQLALIFGFGDEVSPAKICYGFSAKNENLKILGGILEKDFLEKEKVIALAKLPSKTELLARLVGSLNAPISNFVYVLNGNIKGLLTVLSKIKQ